MTNAKEDFMSGEREPVSRQTTQTEPPAGDRSRLWSALSVVNFLGK